ncbi:RFC1 (YOR217W) [Zygosaccharomyces parabailii]|uniref:Replication factor C subunit 1 n=1 Tax=Zygosaccharomyces bailii (strain CLIB 213 / ATCC 58445 / CBS 680 / BCRC 21525 / NBRC 1098 / NCYC 1416 / NRRL Y-2227) TaxID=1333698 RepID=A0A8J2X3T3_ZYGB2|nr:RFC1 (YOR217W) [Zygosaccharomyces parabailii]CDF91013.1 ZYBA0S09-02850g1_1 [Zygosaccharomyces bailii CLIB 213]CDH14036.1 probable RFC1-DNA replication factor C, 95 KD subunit [Zygosaccharomyces bailii ISA1307]
MVTITDFFGKEKKSSNRRSAKPPSKKPEPEIIDLDELEDENPPKSKVPKSKVNSKERKIFDVEKTQAVQKHAPKSSSKTASRSTSDATPKRAATKKDALPKSVATSGATAQDVLNKIPGVDLANVHVKENAQFDFRNQGNQDEAMGGTDDFPEGQPNCLLGLTIVFTGTLPNIERGAAETLAKRYGARVTKSISSKTSVVVLGEEAGPKKVETIKKLKIKAIDEDGFRQLIEGMPAEGGDGAAAAKARKKIEEEERHAQNEASKMAKQEEERAQKLAAARKSGKYVKNNDMVDEKHKLWTVKYAPTSLQQVCGNKGGITKLKNWLSSWHENKRTGFKKPGRDGSGVFRSAMLYGPPGVGKTTAAHLVAKELGYDVLEQNASDVRSKSLLNAGVKNALDNTSVVGYFQSKDNPRDVNGKNFVIVMDEVDGMSGGDRGGVGQLAQFCRKTLTPMILICNERNIPKMRPFDRTCLDIQFRRPDANSIKARLMTIAVREGFKLDPNIVDKLVQATHGDIRQIINLLSTVSKTTRTINHENIAEISEAWEKAIALKPFDITHKLLDGRIYSDVGSQTFNLNDKIALYFDDFDFAPLMVQENYLNTKPTVLKNGETHLEAVAKASDSISLSNLVETRIRSSEQLWSLLPLHAVLSSVYPASKVAGQMAGRINFTTWLGQNSKANKYYRILQELQYHTRLSTSTNKLGLRLEYIPVMKDRLLDPLILEGSKGIQPVIEIMDEYYLTREDWDNIMDFLVGRANPSAALKKIPTAIKTAFTKEYNKSSHPVAIYRAGTNTMASTSTEQKPDFEDIVDADDAVPQIENEEPEEDTNFKKDKLITAKAKPTKRKTKSGKETAAKRRKTKT